MKPPTNLRIALGGLALVIWVLLSAVLWRTGVGGFVFVLPLAFAGIWLASLTVVRWFDLLRYRRDSKQIDEELKDLLKDI